jgi:hypothetical protein
MPIAPLNLPLGKLAPKHDPRTLQFASYVVPGALPPSPPSVSWTTKVKKWGMLKNDTVGDCTCASAGHMVQCWSANAGKEIDLPDSSILSAYSAVSGYDPNTGLNDNGAAELDVLNYWRKSGIGGHKIAAYAALEPGNHTHVKDAVSLFGGCYVGLSLPVSAQTQTVWSVPPGGTTGRGAPGSWGGHAVPVLGYDLHGLIVVTWGKLMRMTWSFWDAYGDEAFAVLSSDWLSPNHKAPNGFDFLSLTQDLRAVTRAA